MRVILKRGLVLGTAVLFGLGLTGTITGRAATNAASNTSLAVTPTPQAGMSSGSQQAQTAAASSTQTTTTQAAKMGSLTITFQDTAGRLIGSPVYYNGPVGQLLPSVSSIVPAGYSLLSGTYYGFIQPGQRAATITVEKTADLAQTSGQTTSDIMTVVTPGTTTAKASGATAKSSDQQEQPVTRGTSRSSKVTTVKQDSSNAKGSYAATTPDAYPSIKVTPTTNKTLPQTSEAAGSIASFSGWGLLAGVIGLVSVCGFDDRRK
ncbi:hypothetical protein AYR62_01875 [Secundilactobacillus paracollinoides]|uniref:Uncharacterized protein n=1 Tax=Secundilactobacillus paracollinoides TaxID=240427 RepID=A0A1B2IUZ1_9LACO|nr:hypothetical protein [Secundilactobacillus paracollinoides]ANZ60069.1 hypothetical protein AYR61_01045 [Secundilactobacillus paracollinoides]ANZ62975.1 hypothetical protein AYR62_01875 [Secundilactobacillus paracollinoides]ANZ65862.1 hypothetical protein AYR63_01060 [Secundilactobacillus paracollinoides]